MTIDLSRVPVLFALIKSGGDPLVNVAGAYFPAWLACMLLGCIGTWLAYVFTARGKFAAVLRPGGLMIPCLFVAITCATWLVFFSG